MSLSLDGDFLDCYQWQIYQSVWQLLHGGFEAAHPPYLVLEYYSLFYSFNNSNSPSLSFITLTSVLSLVHFLMNLSVALSLLLQVSSVCCIGSYAHILFFNFKKIYKLSFFLCLLFMILLVVFTALPNTSGHRAFRLLKISLSVMT